MRGFASGKHPFANLNLAQRNQTRIRIDYDSAEGFCLAPPNRAQKNERQKLPNPHLDRKQVPAAVDTGPLSWIASETRLQHTIGVVADQESPIMFNDEQGAWLRHGGGRQQTEHQQKDKPDVGHGF